MAHTWELICHHTYAGTPGVVYDRSPARSSHGMALNLADGDFLTDGAAAGSGAVRFYASSGVVHIPCTAPEWQWIAGIKGEVTLRREQATQGFMIDSGAFQFFVRSNALNAWFASTPPQYAQINSAWDALGKPYAVPVGKWVTLGFLHDGFGTMELSANGQVIARKEGAYRPVNAPGSGGVAIGNAFAGGAQAEGQIDDVKIWRLNPRKLDQEFRDRPMSPEAAECWRAFLRALNEARRRHPECADQVARMMIEATTGLRRSLQAQPPIVRQRLATLQRRYRTLWRAGNIGGPEMAKVFEALIALLRRAGAAPDRDPAVLALVNADCFRRILADLKPLDCDRQATRLVKSIAARLDVPRDPPRDPPTAPPGRRRPAKGKA